MHLILKTGSPQKITLKASSARTSVYYLFISNAILLHAADPKNKKRPSQFLEIASDKCIQSFTFLTLFRKGQDCSLRL